MAELIDKMQGIMCKSCTSCEVNWCDGEDKAECQWMQEIAEVGTTTEAEIRAKAIDEFAEKFVFQAVCQGCSGCCNCYELGRQMQCGEYQRYMEIAEQLKEE